MKFATALVLAMTLAACESDETIVPPGGGADAGAGNPDAEPTATVWAAGTDFSTAGILSRVAVPSLTVTQDAVAGVASTDPVVRAYGGKLYIVNRFGFDNVTIVDMATGQLVDQISTGSGTNPQDVAIKGDKIYVAAQQSGDVIVLDASNPGAAPATIDISSYDSDGVPDAASLYLVGDDLYVTIGALDSGFVSTAGKVIVIDTTDDTIATDFDLTYNNPFGYLQPHGGQLIVSTTEDFGAGNGCIERIATGNNPRSLGCLVENAELGGYARAYRSDGDTVWLAVSTSFTEAKLVTVGASGTPSASITPAGQQPTDVALCPTGHVVIADSTGGGLRVYGADGTELTTDVLDVGQPPAFVNGLVCR